MPLADPVKISRLTLTNTGSNRVRRLSVTGYVEWVLGPHRGTSAPFVTTRVDPMSKAILAKNTWNPAFEGRVAFADIEELSRCYAWSRLAIAVTRPIDTLVITVANASSDH